MVTARKRTINLDITQYYQCQIDSVRNAFLYGKDKYSGKNYDHRAQWIQDKIFELSKIFSIECCAFGIAPRYASIVIYIDHHKATAWSDEEVIKRWTNMYNHSQTRAYLFEKDKLNKKEQAIKQAEIERYRANLMSISWYMRNISEFIARAANKEDNETGRFWRGRFKTRALLDKQAVILTMIYTELLPMLVNSEKAFKDAKCTSSHLRTGTSRKIKSLSIRDKFVPISKKDYLQLLQLSKNALTRGDEVITSKPLLKLLQKLKFDEKTWLTQIKEFEKKQNIVGSFEARKAFRQAQHEE